MLSGGNANIARLFQTPLSIGVILLAFSTTPADSQAPAQPQAIGLATRVDNQVDGTLEGRRQILTVGSNVYQLEVIRTNQNGKAQFSFLDSTVLSLGPMSEVNLDRFVFNPDQKTGDVVLQMGRGTFRFVTGSQDKRNYRIVTPVATIGVRKTIFHVLNSDMQFAIVVEEVAVTLTLPNGMVLVIDQPGWGVTITPDGMITGPQMMQADASDPFGVGWQQFADAGGPDTTGAGTQTFALNLGPDVQGVVAVTACLNPSCN